MLRRIGVPGDNVAVCEGQLVSVFEEKGATHNQKSAPRFPNDVSSSRLC